MIVCKDFLINQPAFTMALASGPVTLKDVSDETGVPLEQLDKRISQEVLQDLAKHCDPLTVIGHALRLGDEQVNEIDRSYLTTEEKRLALVKMWIRSFGGNATYKAFIMALLKCNRANQAQEVCILASKIGHGVDTVSSLSDVSLG